MNHTLRFAALAVLLFGNHAFAEPSRAERLTALSQKLAAIERQLSPNDLEVVDHHLASLEKALSGFQAPATAAAVTLTCVSNGQPGSYERFAVTDPATSASFGKGTSLANCQQLIATQNHNLVCVSNGEAGSYEKFGAWDLGRKHRKGGLTSLANCQAVVAKARPGFVCHSNGEAGSYEKFRLYNRELDKTVGGDTALDACLAAIPPN